MALLWFDGFESYADAADFLALSSSVIDSIWQYNFAAFGTNYGRNGRGVRAADSSSPGEWTLKDNYTTFIFGAAVRQYEAGTPSYSVGTGPIRFYDGSTIQLYFPHVGTELQVRNGDNTLLGTTSGAQLSYLTWRYIEIKFTIDGSSGSVEIRSNGNTVLNLTSQDTQNTVNAYINKVHLNGSYSGLQMNYDDMYWCDITGDAPHNDFLGDVRIDVLRPDGEGNYKTNFAGSPDVSSNLNVDESPGPDDDTTYNYGSDVADKDTYTLDALPAPSLTTIYGVKSQITVRKTDAGAREVKVLTRAGTTDALGDTVSLSDTYTTHAKIYEDNPDDSAAWEDADVNAMEVGVEITV